MKYVVMEKMLNAYNKVEEKPTKIFDSAAEAVEYYIKTVKEAGEENIRVQEVDSMTVSERVKIALSLMDCETDSVDKLIAVAYYMGREAATKEISDAYNNLLADQKSRADSCRYSKMANTVIGNQRYIYSGDYSGEMTSLFGNDRTNI